MAAPASCLPTATIRDILKNATTYTSFNWSGTTPDTFYCALFSDSLTATADTDPSTYGVGAYASNEVSGTGWAAGGVTMGAAANETLTVAAPAAGQLKIDHTSDISVSGTTLTAARGCLIYDYTLSTKIGFIWVNFGSNYSTSNGTFGITWHADGISYLDLQP